MKQIDIPLGLTYDDVLLVPQKSHIASRRDVDTHTKLSRHIPLAIPFVSSNVDTVTESAMAIAMAKFGGIGIIHRFMPIEREVREVIRVKRSEGFVMGNPLTVTPKQTAADIIPILREQNVSSAVVVDAKNRVLGLITQRDMWFLDNTAVSVDSLMTPFTKLITARPNVSLKRAREIFRQNKIEKLPLINPDRTLAGLITSRTVLNEVKYPQATKDSKGRLRVGAAVGVVGDYLERAQELVRAGVDAIVVDIAHIHSVHGLTAIKKLRSACRSIDIIAGNVATHEGVRDLIREDIDALKVGIGPGGICITRIVAGAGVPQLSAILDCAPLCHKAKIPLIADGGTNYPGDMTKALGAGASTVMITGWLAGTDESPGSIIERKGRKYKIHRGAASFTAVADRKISGVGGQVRKQMKEFDELELQKELTDIVAEGVETFVPYKGVAKEVIHQLVGALRSGMSYSDAVSIPKLWNKAEFIRITPSGFKESTQHNVEEM